MPRPMIGIIEMDKDMFGILNSALKVASAAVDVPVSLAADVVTCGGMTTNKDSTYTSDALKRVVKNASDMAGGK